MKTKNINKKLGLSKSTVVNLDEREMANVNGGWDTVIVCESLMVCSHPIQSCTSKPPR